ncbi:nucleotidyltransferase domain-containing protein [Candidatus Amarolinea dominans]|uniref:nucleotidyltransferase domain-containing protein n=1 Tax=Candidatus Amarolinea dominans TaxID=3140696 RepID=UPI003134BC00|nr:nucleotidyltransferase domain-containing protein [Anaerolineae bacterium]
MTVMTVNVHEAKTQLYDILVQKLAEHFGERLKMLVLFGSQSRGEERRDSDHDIFMVVEDLSHDPLVRQREIMTPLLPVLIHLPERLSVIAKTPHELLGNFAFGDGRLHGWDWSLWANVFRNFAGQSETSITRCRHATPTPCWYLDVDVSALPKKEWVITWEGYRERV